MGPCRWSPDGGQLTCCCPEGASLHQPHLLHPLTLQSRFSPSSFVTRTKALLSLSCWLPRQQTSTHLATPPPLSLHIPKFGVQVGWEASHFCCHSSVRRQVVTGTVGWSPAQDSRRCTRSFLPRRCIPLMKVKQKDTEAESLPTRLMRGFMYFCSFGLFCWMVKILPLVSPFCLLQGIWNDPTMTLQPHRRPSPGDQAGRLWLAANHRGSPSRINLDCSSATFPPVCPAGECKADHLL